MAVSNKVMKRKTPPIVEDPLSFLIDIEIGLSSLSEPLSAPKKSKVDTTEREGKLISP